MSLPRQQLPTKLQLKRNACLPNRHDSLLQVSHWVSLFYFSSHERMRERERVNEAAKLIFISCLEAQPVPFIWIEVYDAQGLDWISLDPACTFSVSSSGHPPASLVLSSESSTLALAIFSSGRTVNVTARYLMQLFTFKPKVLLEWTAQRLALLPANKQGSEREKALVELEVASFQTRMMKGVTPTNIQYYKSHPMYAMNATMHEYTSASVHRCMAGNVDIHTSKSLTFGPFALF